jgi:histidinol-phosphatase (PHP family)
MSWSNYHGHCCYCDGKGEIEEYIKKAKELKIRVLGISSHAPVSFNSIWNMPKEKLPVYIAELNELKQKYNDDNFTLLSSLEVDFIAGLTGPASPEIIAANLDYIIGSVHYAGMLDNGERWTIDNKEGFENGINKIYSGDILNAIHQYFNLQMEMINNEPPDIIGHCDKIRMHNAYKYYFDENSKQYLSQVYDLLKFAAEKEVIVEINTKYLPVTGLLFPAKEHFNWMNDNKIRVTINSDAHNPHNLTDGFIEVAELLCYSGYKELWEWNGTEFAPFGFNKHGILWR